MTENTKLSVCITYFSDYRLSSVIVRHTTDTYYQQILDKYLEIYQTQPKLPCVASNVTHRTTTTGLSVFLKAHRIAPVKLRLAKNKIDLAIIRPSNSSWASPLHLVPKEENIDRRPNDNERRLNAKKFLIINRCLKFTV